MSILSDSKIQEIISFMNSNKIQPGSIFLINSFRYLLVYQGSVSWGISRSECGIVEINKFERGEILDVFSKIELFINEIIKITIIGEIDTRQVGVLSSVLDKVDLFSKISSMKELGVIDGILFDKIMQLKQVRNNVAHLWQLNSIKYRGEFLSNRNGVALNLFKQDIIDVWKRLIDKYNSIVDQNTLVDKLISEMQKLIDSRKS